MSNENAKEKNEQKMELSKEDTALLMKAIWKALQVPKWTKDDLVDLGKAIFSKTPLHKMGDRLYERIFPHLRAIAESIHQQMTEIARTENTKTDEKTEKNEKVEEKT